MRWIRVPGRTHLASGLQEGHRPRLVLACAQVEEFEDLCLLQSEARPGVFCDDLAPRTSVAALHPLWGGDASACVAPTSLASAGSRCVAALGLVGTLRHLRLRRRRRIPMWSRCAWGRTMPAVRVMPPSRQIWHRRCCSVFSARHVEGRRAAAQRNTSQALMLDSALRP